MTEVQAEEEAGTKAIAAETEVDGGFDVVTETENETEVEA